MVKLAQNLSRYILKLSLLSAFEKHLEEAYPEHLSTAYMIACPQEDDRQGILQRTVEVFKRKDPQAQVVRCDGAIHSVENILRDLGSVSLFGSFSLVVVDGAEKLRKGGVEALFKQIANPYPKAHLILGFANYKSTSELVQIIKKSAVFLDLTQEKPWERKERIARQIIDWSRTQKKIIDQEVIEYLFQSVGLEWSGLCQELEKLISYVGEKNRISLAQAKEVCSHHQQTTGWQIAESIVWKQEQPMRGVLVDLSTLLALTGQLRYHLHLGCQIASGDHALLKPQLVQKYATLVKKKTPQFFETGLLALLELEILAKSSSLNPELLLDRFIAQLYRSHRAEIC